MYRNHFRELASFRTPIPYSYSENQHTILPPLVKITVFSIGRRVKHRPSAIPSLQLVCEPVIYVVTKTISSR